MRHLAFLISCLLATRLSAGSDDLVPAWEFIDSFRFNDALEAFQKSNSTSLREKSFGEAVALLNAQPRSEANIRKSARIFEQLHAENREDLIGILSLYYEGRIYQIHLDQPDFQKALEAYDATLDLHSGNPLAEMAAVSILNIRLYHSGRAADPIRILETSEPLVEQIRSGIALREFHLAMGFAYLEFAAKDDGKSLRLALSHLKEAERIGITRWQVENSVWVAIGEASRALGDKATALKYYRKFVNTYKRDRRNQIIRERIEEIEREDRS